ncbi:hypothetical protein KAR52_02085 [Candidatus Pacearchaeota archaeon]|nr:hypothetical protein [Candidatus Pacearchaeota archaeon]
MNTGIFGKKMNMTEKDEQKLKKIIKKGKTNYVLTYGLLLWGFVFPTFLILFNKLIFEEKIDSPFIFYIISIPVGLIIGFWGWKSINDRIKNKNLPIKKQIQKQKKLNWELYKYLFLWLIIFTLLFIGFIFLVFS